MQDILEASTSADWREPDPENTLYLELASGRVVIELAPGFAPQHVANIRALAKAGWYDGLSINRSHDNFVVQWGDADGGDPAKARPLPDAAANKLPAEFARSAESLDFTVLPDHDGWAPQAGFAEGFPAARDPQAGLAWLTHCYGTVGAGRDMAPDSSLGNELYVVIGHAPRQLDRNITSVGRVIKGMELLSTLPRGTGPLGFYEQREQTVPIRAIRLASEVPAAERERLQLLRTDTATFEALVEARRNRRDDWYVHPAGHIDVCSVPLPVREAPKE
ncbi:MAG TPA: peptidylprolyl isomerase [Arenimonas sp.]|nr:peptidylprolyl isomerase [Arenimonas sp.]